MRTSFSLLWLFAACVVSYSPVLRAQPAPSANGSVRVYIGTYTGKKSQGIYMSRLDVATGELSTPELAGEMANPSWVALHPSGKFLFANGEFGPYL